MSMNAIRQLNNGGLKMKSNFSTRSVASNITANRSGMASLVRGNGGGFGANSLFTKSNPIGRGSKYATAGQISRMVNRPAGQVRGYAAPASASYTQSVNFETSSAMNIGSILGTLAGMMPMAMTAINQLGGAKAKSQGDDLTAKLNDSFGNLSYTVPVSNDVSDTISSMTNANDYASLSNAITGAETQLGQLQIQQGVYEEEAANEKSILTQLESQTESLETAAKNAASEANKADQAVVAQTRERDSAQNEANKIDAKYGAAVEEYTKQHDAHIDALQAKDGAKAEVNRANSSLKKAKANTKSAQSSFDDAKKAYDSCPKTRINPQTQAEEPNEPQLSEAKAKMDIAQAKLKEAKSAEQNAQDCKNDADDKLKLAEANVESTAQQEKAALEAKNLIADNLKDKKDQIKKFEEKLKKEQDKLDEAKGKAEAEREKFAESAHALDEHEQKMESLQCATRLADETNTNIESLDKAIQEQKARLAQLPRDDNTNNTNNTSNTNSNTSSQGAENQGVKTGSRAQSSDTDTTTQGAGNQGVRTGSRAQSSGIDTTTQSAGNRANNNHLEVQLDEVNVMGRFNADIFSDRTKFPDIASLEARKAQAEDVGNTNQANIIQAEIDKRQQEEA